MSGVVTVMRELHATKCPRCGSAATAPGDGPPAVATGTTRAPWLVVGAAAVIGLGVGVGGGFVAGHQRGRNDNATDLADAQARAAAADRSAVQLRDELTDARQEQERTAQQVNKVNGELEAVRAAARRAEEEAKAVAAAAKAAQADRVRDEEAARKEQERANRRSPPVVPFKDLANFPEVYAGRCVRIEDVWLDGDSSRVEGSRDLSPTVSSKDGERVNETPYPESAFRHFAFVMPESIGRPLAVAPSGGHRYRVNLNCELRKADKNVVARIYRVETISPAGTVKDVLEEK